MTRAEAFEKLLTMWEGLPYEFKAKYKSYKSKYLNPIGEKIGDKIIKEMLDRSKLFACRPESWKEKNSK